MWKMILKSAASVQQLWWCFTLPGQQQQQHWPRQRGTCLNVWRSTKGNKREEHTFWVHSRTQIKLSWVGLTTQHVRIWGARIVLIAIGKQNDSLERPPKVESLSLLIQLLSFPTHFRLVVWRILQGSISLGRCHLTLGWRPASVWAIPTREFEARKRQQQQPEQLAVKMATEIGGGEEKRGEEKRRLEEDEFSEVFTC